MRFWWALVIILVLFYQAFIGSWVWAGSRLPERMATHFNGAGEADGWMSRSDHQLFMLIFGLAFPMVIVLLSYATRFLPRGMVNIPNRDYWLAPERRTETSSYLVYHSLWLACLAVCFVIGLEFSTLQANLQHPPHLSLYALLVTVIPFLAGTVVWVVVVMRHFRRAL